jgi:hypothetical protein
VLEHTVTKTVTETVTTGQTFSITNSTVPVEEVSLVITDIKVTYSHDTNANIEWTTNKLSNSQVEYGTTSAYGLQTILDEALVAKHV